MPNTKHPDDTDEEVITTEEKALETEETTPAEEEIKSEEKSEWQQKAEEHLTDLKRTQADFENYKKRQAESQKELGGYLIERLVLDIIPVLDNFRSATSHVPPEQKDSPWVTGIQYIEKQLEDVVKQNGVEVMEVKEGDAFDPNLHEAVDTEEKKDDTKQNEETGHTIAKVLQKGFRLAGKVIRPAKVIVK